MSASSCKLYCESAMQPDCSVAALITEKAIEALPCLAWAEPDPLYVDLDNKSGRRDDFVPLTQGQPSWPENIPLVEARLFWRHAALHAVALDDGGCRWARIEEADVDQTSLTVHRDEFSVLTVRDRQRFGLGNSWGVNKNLRAIEYRLHGRLIAWRLMSRDKKEADNG